VVMPVMDGAEAGAAIRARAAEVPILVMSGIGDQTALGRFHKVRIAGFVPKPFAPDQLAQAVAVALQKPGEWAGTDRRAMEEAGYGGPERRTVSS
jgi:two-component system, cell cycle sensor histidine kinase and response regulator CckA